MTNKESIETLKEFIDHFQTQIKQAESVNDKAFDKDRAERDIEAFGTAIKALEQQDKIKAIIEISNMIVQEDVLKYKAICELVEESDDK